MRRPKPTANKIRRMKSPIESIYYSVLVKGKNITAEADPDGESYILSISAGGVLGSYIASPRGFTWKYPRRGLGSTSGCMRGLRLGRREIDPFLQVIGKKK